MKHLKAYKLFESENSLEIYLNDIFLDIQDKEIEVDISYFWGQYKVVIGEPARRLSDVSKTFQLKDVYDSIQMAKSYMSDEGFFLSELRGGSPDKYDVVQTYGLLYGFDLYEKGQYRLFDKPLVYLEIEFKKIPTRQ